MGGSQLGGSGRRKPECEDTSVYVSAVWSQVVSPQAPNAHGLPQMQKPLLEQNEGGEMMQYEFTRNGQRHAVFRRTYGFAVYLRDKKGAITERLGGYTEDQLKEVFPEVFN